MSLLKNNNLVEDYILETTQGITLQISSAKITQLSGCHIELILKSYTCASGFKLSGSFTFALQIVTIFLNSWEHLGALRRKYQNREVENMYRVDEGPGIAQDTDSTFSYFPAPKLPGSE